MNGLSIRAYWPNDAPFLAQLMFDAVQTGAAGHYSEAQRDAWCGRVPGGQAWDKRLAEADTVVAELDGRIVGFMTLIPETGLLDLAFVAPDVMGRGVAQTLYAVLEGRARAKGLTRIKAEASPLAEPFFRRQGWQMVARQMVERGGVSIPNARMEKHLHVKTLSPA